MPFTINVTRRPIAAGRSQLPDNMPYTMRYGFWGVVTEVHPEDCTVHVRMDNGMEVPSVKVASAEWVTIDKDKNALSGERHLPPVNTYVFCMMPTGELSSAFVLCSGFATAEAEHSAFMKSGADAAATWERVCNSGWQSVTDYRTGTTTIANKAQDATITLKADQETVGEEVVSLAIHGNTITINKDGVDFKTDSAVTVHIDGDASVEVGGNVTATVSGDMSATIEGDTTATITGDANIEANKATLTSTETTLTGGKVIIGGTVTPTGNGALCGLPSCLFTGAPHIGDTTEGA